MGAKFDRVINSLQRRLVHESDTDLRRGMHYPTHWDPFFRDYMTLKDGYRTPAGTSTSTGFNSRSRVMSDMPAPQTALARFRRLSASETYTRATSTGTSINGPTTPARACPDAAP